MVHVDVKPAAGLTLDSYEIHVGVFEHSMPPTNTFDVVVPTASIGQPTAVSVAAMDRGKQVAFGVAMIRPDPGVTTDATITLTAGSGSGSGTCPTTCTQGETVCGNSGEGTVTCEAGSDGCYDWGNPKTCPSNAPFCSNGACAASCSDECTSVGETDCDNAAVRTCQTSSNDSCLHWSVPVACDSPPLDTCLDTMTLRTYSNGTCSSGACLYAPVDETCDAPANATADCSAGECGYTCDAGYSPDGSGNCVATAACTVLECGSDADCGDAACGPCSGGLCYGLFSMGGL